MFLRPVLFSTLILMGLALAVVLSLSLFSGSEPIFVPDSTTKSAAPFQHTRLQVRRDIFGQYADQPAHAVLRCQEAELSLDLLSNELTEHMSGVSGYASHEGCQDVFSADIATYYHQRRYITASVAKGARFEGEGSSVQGYADYVEAWLNPEGLKVEARNVHAQDNAKITVDSLYAAYEKGELALNGQVAFGLAMGSLLADQARIEPSTGVGDFSGHLSVLTSTGAHLQADRCHVDRTAGTAIFSAKDKVSYHESAFEARKPLQLTCQQLIVHSPLDTTATSVSQITAQGEVEAIYDDGWELSADRAVYHSGADKRLVIDADQHGGCVVTSPYNDNLLAKRIESTLADNRVTFYELSGELRDGVTMLAADEATWDHDKSTLTCHRGTCIDNQKYGTINAEGDLQVSFQHDEDGFALANARHQGSLHIQGTDKQLSCQGECFLDHQNSQITLAAAEDTDVHFSDAMGQLESDRLHIWYEWLERNFTPSKLTAEGRVRLRRPEEGSLQLAMADELEYLPSQEKVSLRGRAPNRVLYYDPSRQMTASAKGVDIIRDPRTHKISLLGKGDVQFKLMEAELQAMRQYLQGQATNP